MQYTITAPRDLCTSVALPPSKSISNRALIIYALSGKKIVPENLSDCDDTMVMIDALRDMPAEINIKAAGTAMRFLSAYLAVTPGEHVITGTERMKHRPIAVLVDALRYLGADIQYVGEEGFPPLRIKGKTLEGGRLEVPGNISSQYISALLMIGPTLKNGLRLHLKGDIISRPYIDLTLWIMAAYGAQAEWRDKDTIIVHPTPYSPQPYHTESDWSAASYWYEIMALKNNREALVKLQGLQDGSRQGDSIARYLFSLLGVKTTFEDKGEKTPCNSLNSNTLQDSAFYSATEGISLDNTPSFATQQRLRCSGTHVPRLEYDFVAAPDLAQTFVVCCAEMGVHFHFRGLQTLKIKETDRIEALKTEMRKLGFVVRDIDGRELIWDGERCTADAEPVIDTYDDHRMALAFAPLAITRGSIRINNPSVVSKSYPHFWEDLRKAGFIAEEN